MFNKNIFYSNEVAEAKVTVSNQNCNLAITSISASILQIFKVHGKSGKVGGFSMGREFLIKRINNL